MKFTTLFAAVATSISSIIAAPQGGYYYNASGVDALVAVNVQLKADLDAYCTRGRYGDYDAYHCNRSIDAFVGLSINIDLGIHL
jgi:hypothetical protein